MLVCLEGIDSAGKATNAKLLKSRFERDGREAHIYSFPRYETEVGKAIKRHLVGTTYMADNGTISAHEWPQRAPEDAPAFQCLALADKMDAAVDIQLALDHGHTVICDRWWQSALAFGAADGLDSVWLHRIHSGLPSADINIFIDVPPEEALRRRPEARDRYERDREKQKRVRENYKQLWTDAGIDYVTIDGVGTPEQVHARIWSAVSK
jgi:dTMP kinase